VNFIYAAPAGMCFICGGPSNWIEINFEAHLHRSCEWVADQQFWATNLALDIAAADGVMVLL
jgi:hypothetical protein